MSSPISSFPTPLPNFPPSSTPTEEDNLLFGMIEVPALSREQLQQVDTSVLERIAYCLSVGNPSSQTPKELAQHLIRYLGTRFHNVEELITQVHHFNKLKLTSAEEVVAFDLFSCLKPYEKRNFLNVFPQLLQGLQEMLKEDFPPSTVSETTPMASSPRKPEDISVNAPSEMRLLRGMRLLWDFLDSAPIEDAPPDFVAFRIKKSLKEPSLPTDTLIKRVLAFTKAHLEQVAIDEYGSTEDVAAYHTFLTFRSLERTDINKINEKILRQLLPKLQAASS